MDPEFLSSIREMFLWDVYPQLQELAGEVKPPWTADLWEENNEVGLAITQDGAAVLSFTVSFEHKGDGEEAPELRAWLVVERGGNTDGFLSLVWRETVPERGKGLNSRADRFEGDYVDAKGAVVDVLRRKLKDALPTQTAVDIRPPLGRMIAPVRAAVPRIREAMRTEGTALSGVTGSSAGETLNRFADLTLRSLKRCWAARKARPRSAAFWQRPRRLCATRP